ncbi:DnaJ-domain-containing protein [Hypoxylon crocopeplum]|nr:DnaJ-domain-containing protein [Hypoxylon crocopeplum]
MAHPSFPQYDLYRVLGVESTASLDDIKKAYRDLCLKVHPDKANGGSTQENNERFHQVQEAWEILKDEVLRREYDDYRANGARGSYHESNRDADSGRRRRDKDKSGEYGRPGGVYRRPFSGQNPQNPFRARTPFGDQKPPPRDHADNRYPPPPGGGWYEPKPNRGKPPYYEDWSESYYHSNSGPHESGGGFHRPGGNDGGNGGGPFNYRPGPGPAPGPAPGPQYGSHHPGGAPPPSSRLEDRIIAMRMRVEMRPISQDIDNLFSDVNSLAGDLDAQLNLSEEDNIRWAQTFHEVFGALQYGEELYDDLHLRLRDLETGHGVPPPVVHHLPSHLGVLQNHITRMKYAACAARVIVDELSGWAPYEAKRRLLDDLERRLKTFASYQRPGPHRP